MAEPTLDYALFPVTGLGLNWLRKCRLFRRRVKLASIYTGVSGG